MSESVKRDTRIRGAGAARLVFVRVASSLMQAVMLVLLARNTDLVDFGLYSVSIAVGSILIGILGFGLTTRVLRIQADIDREQLLPSFMACTFLSAVICVGSIILFGLAQPGAFDVWSPAAALYVAAEMISTFTQSSLFGEQRLRRAELSIVLKRLIPLVPVAGAAIYAPHLMFQAVTVGSAALILTCLFLFGKRKWAGWNFKNVLGGSRHFWTASLWNMAQQLDQVAVNFWIGPSAAGGYAAAFRIASPVHLITGTITSLMVPRISAEQDRGRRNATSRTFIRIGFAYAVTLVLLSPVIAWVSPILLGDAFSAFSWLFGTLIINSAISVMNQIFSGLLFAEGAAKAVARSTGISTSLSMIAIFISAYSGSLVGVALGAMGGQLLFFAQLFLLWRSNAKKPIV
ncbi:lipopolysaccharide biosynthesis protein [Arthrobacter crystallopoietes]|uniref:lipopolysaccharide biosynthesis protein n=1 Tax=Crystallibacter crystallopoietes TaxID=37928 RepID=UPI001ABE5856|nr:lipopolysaccharide biosynthesis protein [Arthrobacter crystallopoietes]QTG79519.1 lipopolysaccharide biosynthesis protein [Arthrobacter crystallopoietes]